MCMKSVSICICIFLHSSMCVCMHMHMYVYTYDGAFLSLCQKIRISISMYSYPHPYTCACAHTDREGSTEGQRYLQPPSSSKEGSRKRPSTEITYGAAVCDGLTGPQLLRWETLASMVKENLKSCELVKQPATLLFDGYPMETQPDKDEAQDSISLQGVLAETVSLR